MKGLVAVAALLMLALLVWLAGCESQPVGGSNVQPGAGKIGTTYERGKSN